MSFLTVDPITDENFCVVRMWWKQTADALKTQVNDPSDWQGGFEKERGSGWCDGRETAYMLARLMAARCLAEPLEVDAGGLDRAIRQAMKFLSRRQHADGTLDLQGAFSPNEAGFPLPGLVEGYNRLQLKAPDLFDEIERPLKTFLLRAADAVVRGEAHTANHRWAASCAPLAAVHTLWPEERYLKKIERYLADGLDCDTQGVWFEERSPNYNIVANHGLIETAHHLKRNELLDSVIRNLELSLFTLHPNGEADTSTSHRQDRGIANRMPAVYEQARLAALLTGDGRFTSLARLVAVPDNVVFDAMPLPFLIDRYPGIMPRPLPLPDEYDVDLPGLHAARFRSGQTSLTVSADPGGHFYDSVRDNWGGVRRSDDWFHLHHGDVVIQSIHLSVAGVSNIQPADIKRVESGAWRLVGADPGWTHTQHFRPGRPALAMGGEQRHEITVRVRPRKVLISIDCASGHSAIATLNLYVRPNVTLQEGQGPVHTLTAKARHALSGGTTVLLRAPGGAVRFNNLPQARHDMPIAIPPAIGSEYPTRCACLSIGLLMPVKLQFELELT